MDREGHTTAESNRESKAAAVLKQLHDLNARVFFEKVLTASDTSGSKSGRVVIPKVNPPVSQSTHDENHRQSTYTLANTMCAAGICSQTGMADLTNILHASITCIHNLCMLNC